MKRKKGKDSSSSDSVAKVYTSTVRVDAVSINPEAKRHIRIGKQVKDSTTANTSVLVAITTVKGDVNSTSQRISSHEVDSIRRTNGNDSVEHL
jgi:hypothetical protein